MKINSESHLLVKSKTFFLMKKFSFSVKIYFGREKVSQGKGTIQKNPNPRKPPITLTALFTKPPARHSPDRNHPQGPFQLLAPFMAYGSFMNCPRQNHGMARNREADSFVNSAVKTFPAYI